MITTPKESESLFFLRLSDKDSIEEIALGNNLDISEVVPEAAQSVNLSVR